MINLITNKKIIFVGPSQNIRGKGFGEKIDSYDTVIKSNGALDLTLYNEEYRKDYGKRLDILTINNQFKRDRGVLPIDDMKQLGLSTILFKGVSKPEIEKYSYKGITAISLSSTIEKMNKIVKSCLMGPIVFTYLLQFNPKEFYVTGISFYEEKPEIFIPSDYREYYPGYLTKKTKDWADENVPKRPDGGKDGHDKKSNTSYIYNLIKMGKLQTDDFIIESAKRILGE
jgi:hypothetical protein